MNVKKLLLQYSPIWMVDFLFSIYNTYQYKVRHSGKYNFYRSYYQNADFFSEEKLKSEIELRQHDFLTYVTGHSDWFSKYKSELKSFPILEKVDLLENLEKIRTLKETQGVVSLTGGTTGASMKVVYKKEDMQERFAILDHFRSKFGYALGKKTAWFSGKDFVRESDVRKNIFHRDDWINKIRFFSTFHITPDNFDGYWDAFVHFSPEFIVGFPSSVYELCVLANEKGLKYPGTVKVFFPTAETVLPMHRDLIGDVLGCKLVDQYASSEGAPFILECSHGNLHLHPLTGVFEVIGEDGKPANEGELIVTSFSTRGTPLVRYRIGDKVKLRASSIKCSCGSLFPIVESIEGRSSDYLFSRKMGKINLGNISNCTKDVVGIICFQIIQDTEDEIFVKIVAGTGFDDKQKNMFIDALKARVGNDLRIDVVVVDNIEKEASGKFRIIKNKIKIC